VNWTAVAPEAELHLAVQLHAVWNAAVDNSSAGNATALHLFGVRPGQCPPGTYRCAGGPPIALQLLDKGCVAPSSCVVQRACLKRSACVCLCPCCVSPAHAIARPRPAVVSF